MIVGKTSEAAETLSLHNCTPSPKPLVYILPNFLFPSFFFFFFFKLGSQFCNLPASHLHQSLVSPVCQGGRPNWDARVS